MKIDEAIEIKRHIVKWGTAPTIQKYGYTKVIVATQLGIEALEAVKEARLGILDLMPLLLPSETEK